MKEKYTHNDLNGLGEMADSLRANPFTVPDHYFDALNHLTLQRCRHLEISKTTLAVPTGYFSQLQGDIMARVAEEKLRGKVADSGFTVPDGYFDASKNTILNRVIPRETSTAVRKITPRRWLRYAAVACVALVLGITGYFGWVNPREDDRLDAVSDQEILSYLEFYGEPADITYIAEYLKDEERDIAKELNELSDEDIEAYLNNTL